MSEARDIALGDALPDGRYDAFILSAETRVRDAGEGDAEQDAEEIDRGINQGIDRGIELSCVITSGAHRGDVIDLVSTQFATREPSDLVGLPCTLVVSGNEIRLES